MRLSGQKTPDGYYNLDTMVRSLARKRVPIGCCDTCMDARGVTEAMLSDGAPRSSMEDLAEWTEWAEKVVTF